VYEAPVGVPLDELLAMAGPAEPVRAVLVTHAGKAAALCPLLALRVSTSAIRSTAGEP
jgi:hypothetical protein